MKPIAVVTTVASKKEARAMAQALVEARLAALHRGEAGRTSTSRWT
jgi:uncharacterized protein involved in tolerance to divalent cations